MDNITGNRQLDAPWRLKENLDIILGGAGGISSWTALFLSRANIDEKLTLHIFDNDHVEVHNVGGQLYSPIQSGQFKVDAIKSNIQFLCGENSSLQIYPELYTEKSITSHIMIGGFDNMKARKIMYDNWLKESANEIESIYSPLLIDGRLTAEQIQIFCVTPENCLEYSRKHLFHDSAVQDAPCSFKQTSHVAGMIGSLITNMLLSHITNCNLGNKGREVPFFYEYFMPINFLNTFEK